MMTNQESVSLSANNKRVAEVFKFLPKGNNPKPMRVKPHYLTQDKKILDNLAVC